jgi:hypothetical protein
MIAPAANAVRLPSPGRLLLLILRDAAILFGGLSALILILIAAAIILGELS